MQSWNLLSIVTFFPLLGALFILISPQQEKEISERNSKSLALWTSIITFLVSLLLLYGFDSGDPSYQFYERIEIANGLMTYQMGVDGISILFVMLTTFLMPFCILASWNSVKDRVHSFMISFLVLETLIIGTFCSLDIILFYLFFESVLIPMFIIIGVWGGERKVYSAFKFFLYTLLGSVLMLAAIIFLYTSTGSTELIIISENFDTKSSSQYFLWLAFFCSFAVKLPMWPVHTWLPDAHVEAPTSGSVILAAVLLKMGGYGFIRFSIGMLPEATKYFSPLIMSLSIVAIIYTSLVALAQTDMKKLIAYSSVAHMGMVTIGIFLVNQQGIEGAMIQMISHGIVSAALFLCVGVIYDRMHNREIAFYGGLVNKMPQYSVAFMIFMLASVGLPGTSGFIGEFLIILGAFKYNTFVAFFATSGIILGAVYMLFMYKNIIFGTITNEKLKDILDLDFREKIILYPLIIMVIVIGIFPNIFLSPMRLPIELIISNFEIANAN